MVAFCSSWQGLVLKCNKRVMAYKWLHTAQLTYFKSLDVWGYLKQVPIYVDCLGEYLVVCRISPAENLIISPWWTHFNLVIPDVNKLNSMFLSFQWHWTHPIWSLLQLGRLSLYNSNSSPLIRRSQQSESNRMNDWTSAHVSHTAPNIR